MNVARVIIYLTIFCCSSVTFHCCAKVVEIPKKLREHWIPVSLKAEERHTHYPVLTGDTFRSFCDHVVDETAVNFQTDAVRPGDSIFVGMPYVNYFWKHISPFIRHSFVLVTSNGDGTIDQRYLPYLKRPKLIAWFGRNMTVKHPKAHLIPVGMRWHWRNKDFEKRLMDHYAQAIATCEPSMFFREKSHCAYLNIQVLTYRTRPIIKKYLEGQSFCYLAKPKNIMSFLEDLSESKFVISPRGFNIDCHRTWEALYFGSIPVVEAHGIESVYEDLPVIVVDDMLQMTEAMLEEKFEALKGKTFNLHKLHAQYWFDLIKDAQKPYRKHKRQM